MNFLKIISSIFIFILISNYPNNIKANHNNNLEFNCLYEENQDININAKAAILFDPITNTILYAKNINEPKYPASITKLMTTLLTLEYAQNNLSERINMSKNAVFSIPRGSSHIAMNENETLSIEDALYAVLLGSANEVSNALAEHIGGNINTFANMMTKRAYKLGAKNTNFINPNGLHDDNHYTTAYDMALIMKELIKYPNFIKIINTKRHIIPPTEKQPDERIINNSHRMIKKGKYFNENVIGGKTGYTTTALHTLVTYAKKDDINLIVVLLENSKDMNYIDTKTLLDYGLKKYKNITIFDKNNFEKTIAVKQFINNKSFNIDTLDLIAENSVTKKLPYNINLNNIKITFDLPTSISPPIKKNDKIGKINILYKNTILDEVNLLSKYDINGINKTKLIKNHKDSNILKFLLFLYIILLALITIIQIRKKRKKSSYAYNINLKKSRSINYNYKKNSY